MPPTTSGTPLTNAPLNDFIGKVETNIIGPIVTLLALAAFVVFIWGVVEYIRNADDAEARTKGQQHILWGLIGFVIIFGSAAIIAIIQGIIYAG